MTHLGCKTFPLLGILGEKYLGDHGLSISFLFLKNGSLMHPITACFLLLLHACLVWFCSQLSTALRRGGGPEMCCTAGALPSAESWTRRQ